MVNKLTNAQKKLIGGIIRGRNNQTLDASANLMKRQWTIHETCQENSDCGRMCAHI